MRSVSRGEACSATFEKHQVSGYDGGTTGQSDPIIWHHIQRTTGRLWRGDGFLVYISLFSLLDLPK